MFNLQKNKLYDGALEIIKTLLGNGYDAYFVGGVVRDTILGKPVKDIDIVTSALPQQVKNSFSHTFDVGISFGIVVVVINGINYEVATFREEREYSDGRHPGQITYTDNPKLDAARRDFTINAMFYNPLSEELLDFYGGRDDLSRGMIRTVGDARIRFKEDYLRLLRAVRFCSRFRFKMDTEIISAIRELKEKISGLSSERIREELTSMLTGRNPAGAIELLQKLGLLKIILPEISRMKGVEQPEEYHPEGDVFVHTMLMLKHMAIPTSELAWSILLHDVGKPAARTIGEDGIAHFYGHEAIGANMAETILKRLKFSKKMTACIVHAVRDHMRFAHVDQMRQSTWKRLMAAEHFPMELELHRIDCISSNGLLGNYALLLDRLPEFEAERNLPAPLIAGADLIRIGLKPGPLFGNILKTIREMQLNGEIHTAKEALSTAKQLINK